MNLYLAARWSVVTLVPCVVFVLFVTPQLSLMSRVGEMSNGFGETCFGTEDEKNDSLNLHDISQTLIMSI